MSKIEAVDRHSALGVARPNPETTCRGQCKGMGTYPIEDAEAEDGWRRIICEHCNGSGSSNALQRGFAVGGPGPPVVHEWWLDDHAQWMRRFCDGAPPPESPMRWPSLRMRSCRRCAVKARRLRREIASSMRVGLRQRLRHWLRRAADREERSGC